MAIQLVLRGAPPYPVHLPTYLGQAAPAQLTIWGRDELPVTGSLALLCSAKVPAGILLAAHDLAQRWRQQAITVISGFQSPAEEEVWAVLWRDVVRQTGRPMLVRVLARAMSRRLSGQEQAAIATGRLTLVSPFGAQVRRMTRETAAERNRVAAALAETVLIAHAHEGSATWRLAQAALAWGKPVVTLDHPANTPLRALGATFLTAT